MLTPAPVQTPPVDTPKPPITAPLAADPSEKGLNPPVRPVQQPHVEETLLAVISQLTGYPTEMLGLEMDIEADLGIDSIKRVEILSAIQEKMPHLPAIEPEKLGTLKSLQEVVDQLAADPSTAQISTLNDDAARSDRDRQVTEPLTGKSTGNPSAVEETLLTVVSQLTGYPTEMLALEMDIEADLGIDSIKRVEILSAIQEQMPHLPTIDPEQLGSLKSLRDVVNHLAASPLSDHQETATGDQPQPQPAGRTSAATAPDTSPLPLETTLLEVVSQLTGYPQEMLDLEMDIEADLGIDSIKRVEILSALQEKWPELPAVDPEAMGTLKTLGDICGHLTTDAMTDPASGDEPLPMQQVPQTPAKKAPFEHHLAGPILEKKCVVVRQLPPRKVAKPVLDSAYQIFLAGVSDKLTDALQKELGNCGISSTLLPLATEMGEVDLSRAAGLIIIEPENLSSAGLEPKGLLKRSLLLAKQFAPHLNANACQGATFLATITRMDGQFGLKDNSLLDSPISGGLSGLAKTASHEWPETICRAIDLDPDWHQWEQIAPVLTREIFSPQASEEPMEIGLSSDGRICLDLETTPYPEGSVNLNPGEVVIVTGGARGVTAVSANSLARRCQPTIVIIGRTPPPAPEPDWLQGLQEEVDIKQALLQHQFAGQRPTPREVERAYRQHMANREVATNLAQLKQAGSQVVYCSVDVRDQEALQAQINEIRAAQGPIKAVIHGAGVLEDRLITDKTPDQFDRVYDTKVQGLQNLLGALDKEDLTYLILFSSVTARFGNKGQADYAMANEALNKIAQQERIKRSECRVIAFNWGPWDGGMVSPALKRNFEQQQIALIPPEAGAMSMVLEMMGSPDGPVELVIGGPIQPELQPRPEATADKSDDDLSLAFKHEIDLNRYPVISSHVPNGNPEVPLALMTEWIAHGALHSNPGLTWHGLDDIQLLRGIKVNHEKKVIRLMTGKPFRENGFYKVDVEIRDGFKNGQDITHCKATAILCDQISDPPAYQPPSEMNMSGYPRSLEEIYRDILYQGGPLQGIKDILAFSGQGITARILTAPDPRSWINDPIRTSWMSDPLIIDSAIQLATLWSHENMGQAALPAYSASYRQYCPRFPKGEITAVLDIAEAADGRIKGNFTFIDQNNTVLARLEGYEALLAASK